MSSLVPDQELSFEEALTLLEALVARLEEGQLPLAEAVEHYERGMGLAAYCTDLLESAELRVRQVDAAAANGEDAAAAEYDLNAEIDRLLFNEDDGET